MKGLDRFIQARRISQVAPLIPMGARVLDIGCADGALFRKLAGRISEGIGLDPDGRDESVGTHGMLRRGFFPQDLPDTKLFDVICLLAVLEHIPEDEIRKMAKHCLEFLRPGGLVVATVPSPQVDGILDVLKRFRFIDGMALEQHYGLDPARLPALFISAGFQLTKEKRFQFGLNNLFVFEAPHHRTA